MNTNEALGLPKGSVRAILSLMLIASLIYLAAGLRVTEAVTALVALAGAALQAYFAKPATTTTEGGKSNDGTSDNQQN